MPLKERPSTARGRHRRARLLEATATLVAERGFHAVGVADIGAAAGVTGAAVYRHFATKTELLVALIDQVVDGLRDRAAEAAASREPLDALVRAHVDFALTHRAVIAVYDQEFHNLPASDRRRLRQKQRLYVEEWVRALVVRRPALARAAALARVQAVFGLLNSVSDFPSPLPDGDLGLLLASMAHSALNV